MYVCYANDCQAKLLAMSGEEYVKSDSYFDPGVELEHLAEDWTEANLLSKPIRGMFTIMCYAIDAGVSLRCPPGANRVQSILRDDVVILELDSHTTVLAFCIDQDGDLRILRQNWKKGNEEDRDGACIDIEHDIFKYFENREHHYLESFRGSRRYRDLKQIDAHKLLEILMAYVDGKDSGFGKGYYRNLTSGKHMAQYLRRKLSCPEATELEELEDGEEWMLCPLSAQIMTDPVVAADGYTYEKASIEEWIRHHPRGRAAFSPSPITKETMSSNQLIPNKVIRDKIIQDYVHKRAANRFAFSMAAK